MIDRSEAPVKSNWAGLKVLVLSPTPTDPLDCGNRRRIYFVCKRIKQLGGEIHFLHYPSEEQWAVALPAAEQRRMIADWDGYYLAPVTRRLYTPAREKDHGIDEWWDPGIGDMLNWLFRVQPFDVFIVNYIWLSKAFEYTPAGVVKIIDTHDRFTDRRTFFEVFGLEPDYFHVGEEDERVGLQRADIVWAIKSEEEELFRRVTNRPVLTLAHAEPVAAGLPKIRNDILRFGITGSANEVNIENFRNFLTVADDYIRRTLLPCEIVIGGACCERLADLNYPFVRQIGRLEHMDEFYDQVDVILGPMEFSTGLKIRIGEALSRVKAVVAHRHCFEGYAPTHAFHQLKSFEAMMQACRDLVRAPELIDELEAASVESMHLALREVHRTLEATLAARREGAAALVFVLDLGEAWEGSVAFDHVFEAAQYVGHQCPIAFFLDGERGRCEPGALSRLEGLGRVLLSPRAAAVLGREPGAPNLTRARVTSFEALLADGQLGFWFGSLPARLPAVRWRFAASAFVPIPVLAQRLDTRRLDRALARLERTFGEVIAMDRYRSPQLGRADRRGASTHLVPSLWCSEFSGALKAMAEAERVPVTFFTSAAHGVLVDLVCGIARRATSRPVEIVYDDRLKAGARIPAAPRGAAWPEPIPLSLYAERLGRGRRIPALLVELGHCEGFGALCELMDRSGVPRLALFEPSAPRPAVAGRAADRVGGVIESAVVLAQWLGDEPRFADLAERGRARYRALDPGWTIIWDLLGEIGERRRATAETAPSEAGDHEIGTEIVLRVGRRARRYMATGWVGDHGAGEGIEAFGIRPLEALAAADIEYKGLGTNGRETPWVSDARLCDGDGEGLALTGFAVRLAPHLRDRFDVVYEGAFIEGGVVGPIQNGAPCAAEAAGDRLEAIRVRLVERAAG
jgi:hypothetical protein